MQKTDKSVVIPFFGGLMFPFEKIAQRFKDFFLLVGGFSFLSALLSMFLGRGFACGFGLEYKVFFCGNTIWNLSLNTLFLFVLIILFIHRWWLIGFDGKSLVGALKTKVGIKDLKIAGFLFSFLLLVGVLGVCVYALYTRKATPNLEFEIAWFIFVSLFIIAILFVLINAVVFVRFLDDKKWLVFDKTALPIFDNIYKLMGWFLFYMLFFSYLAHHVSGVFIFCQKILPLDIAGLVADFVLFVVFYLMIGCIISLLKYQEIYIFANEKD